jgi:hypothetical protein
MASEWIRSRYMLKLEQAPFNMDDASFVQGSCSGCLKRTGAAPDIFADVKGADVCTDPSCYDNKVQVHRSRVRDALEADGHTVIDEREAKEIMPYAVSALVGYARLDAAQDNPAGNGVTLRVELASVLESGELKPVMLANPHKDGELIACVPDEDVHRWLVKAGRKDAAAAAQKQHQADEEKQADKQIKDLKNEFERTWRLRLLAMIKGEATSLKSHTAMTRVIRIMAMRSLDDLYRERQEDLAVLLGMPKDASGMSDDPRLSEWLASIIAGNTDGDYGEWTPIDALILLEAIKDSAWSPYNPAYWDEQTKDNNIMLAVADAKHISIDAIKATVQAEMTEREAQKAAEKQAALESAKAPLPLAPAAQANGGRGEAKAKKGKGKNPPADAGAGLGRLSAQEAMQGIADALQGDEAPDAARRSEAISGADAQGEGVGPASRPDGAAQTVGGGAINAAHDADTGAQAEAGGATPSLVSQAGAVIDGDGPQGEGLDAGGSKPVQVGDRVRITFHSPTFTGKLGTVILVHKNKSADVTPDGMEGEYTFESDEFERVEGGAA